MQNAWVECGMNAKLFYDAFRGLCRLRIDYAKNKASKMLISAQLSDPNTAAILFEKQKFWTKVQDYWKGKLELSYQWEKNYFKLETADVPEYPPKIEYYEVKDETPIHN